MRLIAITLSMLLLAGCGAATNTSSTSAPASASPSSAKPSEEPTGESIVAESGPARHLTDRQWKFIARDADSHKGKRIFVYCVITQSDAATGEDQALADCGGKHRVPEYGYVDYPTNTILSSGAASLSRVAEDDLVTVKAIVLGAISYDTQIGGETTAPALEVEAIKVTGQQKG